MKCVTKNLAAEMESCIKQTHIAVTQQYSNGSIFELSGGAACFSGFDSYLSQVVGWGFATKKKYFKSEIERIEQFYKNLNHPRVDIELCPFVGNDLTVFLSQRGYKISELNNVSILDVKKYQNLDCGTSSCTIRKINPSETGNWAQKVALGFNAPEAEDQFFRYAQSKGIIAYAVYDQNTIVAGATVAIHGDFCDLGVTSTLPAYRGRGIQKNLLKARLNDVKDYGLSWAMVTTEPGSISDCNVQKVGFHCAYTRIKMTLE